MYETASLVVVAQIMIAQLASFASLLLALAAAHKLANLKRAARAAEELTGAPRGIAVLVSNGIAAAELLAAVGLWVAPLRFDAALLAAIIWSGYFVFLLRAVAAGRSGIDCGCSFGAAHRPLGIFQMLRAALLALLGFLIALASAIAPGALAYDVSAAAVATQLLAGAALLALYVAADQVLGLRPLRAGVQS